MQTGHVVRCDLTHFDTKLFFKLIGDFFHTHHTGNNCVVEVDGILPNRLGGIEMIE
ncbi:hypothetical protein SDC9_75656 [bioreactor metagenome]|uniref:Uncharacterized protein n=1 Tax=bioreactor metagenome TaxID=1076179 RepID=A0A644YLD0_9ZZZZ